MHEKFIAWFYGLESAWDVICYNVTPYLVAGFFFVALLICAFWISFSLWGFLQCAFSLLWDSFKPFLNRITRKVR